MHTICLHCFQLHNLKNSRKTQNNFPKIKKEILREELLEGM